MTSPVALLRRVGAALVRPARRAKVRRASSAWPPHSRLFLVSDVGPWVIGREMEELARIARRLGIEVGDPRWGELVDGQAMFFGSQFDFFARAPFASRNRLATAHYHGRPGTPGSPEFDVCYDALRRLHGRVDRIQVTHSEMREIVLSSGIDAAKVFTIPIGVDLEKFPPRTAESSREVRARHGIPESAVVLGSFQKDGVGWGEGMEPKLIKGPDVLLDTVELLSRTIPELFVFLAGPARGFVRAGLERLGVPHRLVWPNPSADADALAEVGRLYHALDLYVISSRQEGGPKAVLESMAAGVPLVTTRVGHAMDVVRHGENGWLVDVEDVEGLAHWAEHAVTDRDRAAAVVREARRTAEEHSYDAQLGAWRAFMSGFVEVPRGDE